MLIAFKLKIALACAAGLAGPLAVAPLISENVSRDMAFRGEQTIVELQPSTVSYRVAGDFTRAGRPAEAPLVSLHFERPLSIMKHQVSLSLECSLKSYDFRSFSWGGHIGMQGPKTRFSGKHSEHN
jgi:hypothetical protein